MYDLKDVCMVVITYNPDNDWANFTDFLELSR